MERNRIGGMSSEEVADLVAGVGVSRVERLTAREVEVLRLLAAGCTYARVADRLGVSTHTVCSHIKNTYRKLDVHSASAAVWRAAQLRLLGEPGEAA